MHSRRALATRLERVADFEEPRIDLEQYQTPAELAASICHLASLNDDLAGCVVVDLGTGTGSLALGAAFAGPERVVGVECDRDAILTARRNEARLFDRRVVDWVPGDATRPPVCPDGATVLSNPPFGAVAGRRHADRRFLESARSIASVSYTVHNEGSAAFVEAYATDRGATVTDAFEAAFPVDRRFEFHTSERETLSVEVFRIEWENDEA